MAYIDEDESSATFSKRLSTKAKRLSARLAGDRSEFANNLLANYGLTLAQYDAMYVAQGGRCGACGQQETIRTRKAQVEPVRLAVDHCHKTGKVRGLLCMRCNTVLGQLERAPELVSQLEAYLIDK